MLRIIRDPRRRYKTNQRAAQTKKQKRINIEIGGPGVLKTTLSEHPLIFLSIYCRKLEIYGLLKKQQQVPPVPDCKAQLGPN